MPAFKSRFDQVSDVHPIDIFKQGCDSFLYNVIPHFKELPIYMIYDRKFVKGKIIYFICRMYKQT